MNNLLKKTAIVTAVSVALIGCGSGTDEGYSHKFKNDYSVEYSTDSINVTYDEVSGIQQVNLLEGAMVNGEALTLESSTSPIHIRDFSFSARNDEFITPQAEGLSNNQGISPFIVADDGVTLLVLTDAYAQALRMCDTTDVRGATDADGNPTGNGSRDFPTSITYDISYVVDNGFELAPGQEHPTRSLVLTINAITDPVTSVQAFDMNVASGDTTPMLSATLPTYACNSNLTFEIADETTASVDESGNVTGNNKGETTITVTSEENPELSASATVNVTPGFNLAITNQEFNDLGAPLGTKLVPTCSAIGVSVKPTIVADTLSGDYHYTWMSDNATFANEESDGSFGATGRFLNGLATGESATITVGLDNGYTGATSIDDVQEQMVTVTAERNYACEPGEIPNGPSDLLLNAGGWGANATHVAGGLDGTALQITSNNDGAQFANTTRQVWNQNNNFHAATFGRGDASIGRTFKFSVWAKLNQLPAESTDEIKLEHTILPWLCDGCDGLTGFPGRYEGGVVGTVTAELKHTTDWQLVEFINPLTGTMEWTVPSNWNVATAAFQFWDLYGFANGDSIMLDNYSIVEVE
ncbi:Ig-like domain-containing protein [Colwellia sp. 1_MG-2023]|uniref:Ig-like domain-containing protein n=1 Tax=Colwellia sp. 1_MG-2023 TaxID=3062649 RepID=UPI0026E33EE2|nr:Ig-like domain-containing protein [Colwellia sp. 1_MG-2023]MDO6444165.1 Ig-like domain-containing protein [Colwellia sp. 1_MG-2023]